MNPNHVIDELGGTTAVAKLCEVEPQAVSQWRENGIPAARLMYLRVIRPDVFNQKPKHSTKVIDNKCGSKHKSKVGSGDTGRK